MTFPGPLILNALVAVPPPRFSNAENALEMESPAVHATVPALVPLFVHVASMFGPISVSEVPPPTNDSIPPKLPVTLEAVL